MTSWTAESIAFLAGGLALLPVAWLVWRSRTERTLRRVRAEEQIRDFCLCAIDYAREFRVAVEDTTFEAKGLPRLPRARRWNRHPAMAIGPFPARDDLLVGLGEISDAATQLSRRDGRHLDSHPREHWTRWAGIREASIRQQCDVASPGLKFASRGAPGGSRPALAR
ncbi:MAG TPA: hypothetical protein VFS92_10885 [Planctomycetota bacterium]|nr:hypothetical protein [Planctomycetota bacterium]